MPIVMVTTAPSRDLYEQVTKLVDLAAERPTGLILHAASELAGGEVQIVDVWESDGARMAFGETRLFPAFEAAGVGHLVQTAPPPPAHPTFDFVG